MPTPPSSSPSMRTSPPSPNIRWGPYSSAKQFDANIAMVLIALVFAMVLAFFLHATVRLLLVRFRRLRHQHPSADGQAKQPRLDAASVLWATPAVVYSAGAEVVAGLSGAECAICLAEFTEGDRVRILPACRHGFHAECVEAWLATRPSCPTCRRPFGHQSEPTPAAAEEP